MIFASTAHLKNRKTADLLVLPFWKDKNVEPAAEEATLFVDYWQQPVEIQDFKAKEGESLILYPENLAEPRLVLLGLGEKSTISVEKLRRAYAALTKLCQAKKIQEVNLVLPQLPHLKDEEKLRGVTEGLLLANYVFSAHRSETLKDNPVSLLSKVTFINAKQDTLKLARFYATLSEGVYLARDLVNRNADEVHPQYLVAFARALAKEHPSLKATLLGRKELEKEKMGLLLTVGRASPHDPALIVLEYRGHPKSKDLTALIGKGITYDTGGLNLKGIGMESMRCDMGGAAAVLATLATAAKLALPINVTAVVPAAENCLSANSYKPGDVYTSYSGKTVEIGNTDAEGRLILADALTYTIKHLHPTRIIDLATLTGGVDIALGNEAAGLMSNDDKLADLILQAGINTYERVWPLPLYEEYKDALKSDIADLKNISNSRSASPIIGAIFLQNFVNQVPWAHLDIASTAFLNENKRYHPRYATGFGVRLLIEVLQLLNS
jgi:leucyl aminopeptidase